VCSRRVDKLWDILILSHILVTKNYVCVCVCVCVRERERERCSTTAGGSDVHSNLRLVQDTIRLDSCVSAESGAVWRQLCLDIAQMFLK